jgi:hypothetical protein
MAQADDTPRTLTRVIVGPYPDSASAASALEQLGDHEWPGMLVDYPVDTQQPLQRTADASAGDAEMLLGADSAANSPADADVLILAEDQAGESPGDDELLIIEDSLDGEQHGMDGTDDEGAETLIIDEPASEAEEVLLPFSETTLPAETDTAQATGAWTQKLRYRHEDFSIGLDKARLEYGNLYKSDATADSSNYGHLAFSADWQKNPTWEMQLSGRLDWYHQTGDPDFNETELDYGESFVRFRGDNFRLTAGTQTIIWGRIDEVPPTDRMSRVDFGRGILDPLNERRRALPAIRFEGFHEGYKLDAVMLPDFRKAFLPEKDSVWYSINQSQGTLLGFEQTPLLETLVRNGSISENSPSGTAGYGLRLSNTGEQFDYALTVQRVRQSLPYWELNTEVRAALLAGADPISAIATSGDATFKARYPRAWLVGGDFGFEAVDATWRFEAAWISDTPVTRSDLRYDEVDSANWAAGVEFHPGDSEFRVNLQIVGTNMIDAPSLLDRKNTYNFNGSVHGEFGQNRWRTDIRFFAGLDARDIYVNPEVAFIGWEPHEIYAAWHYFDGDDETIGGYWEDSSLLTLGWRARF